MNNSELASILEELNRPCPQRGMPRRIDLCEQALKLVSRQAAAVLWSWLQNMLAISLVQNPLNDRAENLEQAIAHYQNALQVYSPGTYPHDCRRSALNLGNVYFEIKRWQDASETYFKATEAAGILYRACLFQQSKEEELRENGDLYRRAAYALACAGHLKEAAVAVERGRAQGLGEVLARDRADLGRVKELDIELFKRFQDAVTQIRQFEATKTHADNGLEEAQRYREVWRDEALKARSDLDEVISRIRQLPDYQKFMMAPDWDELVEASEPGKPFIYLVVTSAGSLTLVVYNDASQAQTVVEALLRHEFKEDELHKLLEGWFQSYSRFHLAYLPLHAAWTEENDRRLYALDRLAIRYAPSARALNHARRMEKAAAAKHFFAVDNPLPITQPRPLRYSYQEVSAVEVHFSQENKKVLHNEEATKEAVLQELPQAQVAHFSCQGSANPSEPEESGLLLARDERLTVRDLFQLRLTRARMAVLSACESGVVGSKLPDEVASLPSAFLQAGFAGVLASLWSVDERSTSQLMDCFYRLWLKEGLDPAFALQKAQQSLRDNHWKDSFYWAAFYLSGV